MICFIDIETQRTDDPELIARLQAEVQPPGNISKAETIAAWWKEKGSAAKVKAVSDTALDGTYGRLATIGFAFDDDAPVIIDARTYDGDEEAMLVAFGAVLRPEARLCAFNGEFDFRFLMQRSVIKGVNIGHMPLDRGDQYIDPMRMWAGFKGYVKQTDLEKALGFTRTDPLAGGGADVGEAIDAGDWDSVIEHNRQDILGLRHIYRRITFGSQLHV